MPEFIGELHIPESGTLVAIDLRGSVNIIHHIDEARLFANYYSYGVRQIPRKLIVDFVKTYLDDTITRKELNKHFDKIVKEVLEPAVIPFTHD